MPEPLSPLFEELYLRDGLERSTENVIAQLHVASGAFDRLVERPIFTTVNGFAYQRADVKMGWLTIPILVGAMAKAIPALFREGVPLWRDRELPLYLRTIESWKALDPVTLPDDRLLAAVRTLALADARYWFAVALAIGTAKVTDSLLDTFLDQGGAGSAPAQRPVPPGTLGARAGLRGCAGARRRPRARLTGTHRIVNGTPPERLREALAASPEPATRLGRARRLLRAVRPPDLQPRLRGADPGRRSAAGPGDAPRTGPAAAPRRRGPVRPRWLASATALTRSTDRSFGPVQRRLFRLLLGWATTLCAVPRGGAVLRRRGLADAPPAGAGARAAAGGGRRTGPPRRRLLPDVAGDRGGQRGPDDRTPRRQTWPGSPASAGSSATPASA